MRTIIIKIMIIMTCVNVFAGNSDRAGEAGGSQLLLNTNARSSGMNGINAARVRGIAAFSTNIAGLAYAQKTNIGVNYTSYLTGTNTNIYNLSFAQELSPGNVIGICVNSMDFGRISKTTTLAPEGVGNFSASLMNLGLSYGRLFTEHISGGIQVKFVAESLDNISASGVAFDAGLQYSTGKRDNIHFGVHVRNVGTNMSYSGDGLIYNVNEPNNRGYKMSQTMQGAKFGLPSLLCISGAYDLYLGKSEDGCNPDNRLTIAADYIYNSFTNDQYGIGLEYALKEMFSVRAGYLYESKITTSESIQAKNGFTAGASFDMPLDKTKKNGPAISIDYGFAMTTSFNNNHSLGLTYTMGNPNNTCSRNSKLTGAPAADPRANAMQLTKEDNDTLKHYADMIKFKSGSDELNSKGEMVLNKIHSILRAYKRANINVAAHTDNVGNPESNMELSQKRAEMVKSHMITRGIKPEIIKTEFFGETKPRSSNETEEGQAQNRRVEIAVDFK